MQLTKSSTRHDNYKPGAAVTSLKDKFDKLNRFVMSRHGWLISVPGKEIVTLEVLPGSILISELREAGYDLEPAGEGQRILAGAITEKFGRRADGELEPVTPESTKAVVEIRTHAGITRTERFTFAL